MYYTASDGVHESWRENIQNLTQEARNHNWLPAAVAAIMIAWVSLIVLGFQQGAPFRPAPEPGGKSIQTGKNGNLQVTNVSSVLGKPGDTSTPSNQSSTAAAAAGTLPSSMQTTQAAVGGSDDVGGIVGGKGGDGMGGVTQPATQVTEPVTSNPVVSDPPVSTGSGGVTVETPVTPPTTVQTDPIVDLPGVNAQVDTGGVLPTIGL